MKLFLDCEFNSFKGQLISMALVSEDGREWYEVLKCENPHEWVAEHVIPILNKAPLNSVDELTISLAIFLRRFPKVHIIADWPEDIKHFCEVLITGPGVRINTPPMTLEIIRLDCESELPHNALADARGIKEKYLRVKASRDRLMSHDSAQDTREA